MIVEIKTIQDISSGEYKEKGSKFLAYAHPVSSEEEVKELVKAYKKEYFDARHHCYAYILGAEKSQFRAADDGEPSNSAGNPILGQIRSNELTNVMVMVVRYFGGTKLGVPGLIHAYRSACSFALENSTIVLKKVSVKIELQFEYPSMNEVMKVIKDYDLKILSNKFDNTQCIYHIEYNLEYEEVVLKSLKTFII